MKNQIIIGISFYLSIINTRTKIRIVKFANTAMQLINGIEIIKYKYFFNIVKNILYIYIVKFYCNIVFM